MNYLGNFSEITSWKCVEISVLPSVSQFIHQIRQSIRQSVNISVFFSQDDIWHGSAQSLSHWFCSFWLRDPKMRSKYRIACFYLLHNNWADYCWSLHDDSRQWSAQSSTVQFSISVNVTPKWGQRSKYLCCTLLHCCTCWWVKEFLQNVQFHLFSNGSPYTNETFWSLLPLSEHITRKTKNV